MNTQPQESRHKGQDLKPESPKHQVVGLLYRHLQLFDGRVTDVLTVAWIFVI